MAVEQIIDDLLESAWAALDSDFDQVAFHHWRCRASDCLIDLLGPNHVYTRQFENFTRQDSRRGLLAAGGILSAAQQMTFKKPGTGRANGGDPRVPLTEKIGGPTEWRAR
jgi:hypothetical protein